MKFFLNKKIKNNKFVTKKKIFSNLYKILIKIIKSLYLCSQTLVISKCVMYMRCVMHAII